MKYKSSILLIMGIHHLGKIISSMMELPDKTLHNYFGKIIAVDISLFIHKSLHSKNDGGIVQGIFNLISILLKYKIIPIMVFDGKPPLYKLNTIRKRKIQQTRKAQSLNESFEDDDYDETILSVEIEEQTSKEDEDALKIIDKMYHMSKEKVDEIKHLLDILGISYIHHNNYEADFVCAELVKSNVAYACLSNDYDLLAYGCPRVLRNFNIKTQTVNEYNLSDICKTLEINFSQLIDFTLLLGTDICPKLKGFKTDYKLELIKKYKTIENVLLHIQLEDEILEDKTEILSIDFYNNIKKIYSLSSIVGKIDFTINIVNLSNCCKLYNIIKKKYGSLNISDIHKMLMNINNNNTRERIQCIKQNARYNKPNILLSLGYEGTINYLLYHCPKLKRFIIEDKLDYIIYL